MSLDIYMFKLSSLPFSINTLIIIGDTFKGMKNITIVTSNGLVYSWGENLIPRPHAPYKSKSHSRDEGLIYIYVDK